MASKRHPTLSLPFSTRAAQPNSSPLASYLLSLISIKRSNLCVSADVHRTYDLLTIAEEVGDHICVLKTHADIIDDWSEKTMRSLQDISRRKRFLIFEDRKLGDIGSQPHPTLRTLPPPHLLPFATFLNPPGLTLRMSHRHSPITVHPRTPRHLHLGSPHKRPPPPRPFNRPSSSFRRLRLPYIS